MPFEKKLNTLLGNAVHQLFTKGALLASQMPPFRA